MKKCIVCKFENDESAMFCSHCGSSLDKEEMVTEDPAQDLKKLAETLNEQSKNPGRGGTAKLSDAFGSMRARFGKLAFFRNKKIWMTTLVGLGAIVIAAVVLLNSGYFLFKNAYSSGNLEFSQQVYGWFDGQKNTRERIGDYLRIQGDAAINQYANGTISLEEARALLNDVEGFIQIPDIKKKLEKLEASKKAFADAEALEAKKDQMGALVQYIKVIEEDALYESAQQRIAELKPAVKQEVLATLEQCKQAYDFNSGLELIASVSVVFPNDAEIKNYKTALEDQKEKHKIQELKEGQKVVVTKAYAYDDGYYITLMKGTIVLKNKTNQVVKTATIGILQFDRNGYPVEVEYSMYGDENLYRVGTGSANIQPGGTYGSNYYYNLPDNCKKIKACVISAEFYDGGTWTNEYYDYWLSAQKDRY